MANDECNDHTLHRFNKSNWSSGLCFFLVLGDCSLVLAGYPSSGSLGEGGFPLSLTPEVVCSFPYYSFDFEDSGY